MTKLEQVARAVFIAWRKDMDQSGYVGEGLLVYEDLDEAGLVFALAAARAAVEEVRKIIVGGDGIDTILNED